jgi:transcriptional regulator with XRE-family HTH domain
MDWEALDPKAIGDRIVEVVGDEPKAFAYDMGVSVSAMYNYMNGKRIPSTEALFRLARCSGRSMEWFLVGHAVEAVAETRTNKRVA